MSSAEVLSPIRASSPGRTRSPRLSVVVPLYNESAALPALYARLTRVLDGLDLDEREMIFVDDGSQDDSFAVLLSLRQQDPCVKALRFARNFGKEAAMAAGLRAAAGDAVILMDGDLQHPPELIPELLARWRAGVRVVTAVRRSRATDPWLRRHLSLAFYRLFGHISEVRLDSGAGDFRLFDRTVVDAINSLPERTRFMKGISSWVGFRQESVTFEPAPRRGGRSAWPLLRLWTYATDGLFAFSTLPLRVWSVLGIVMAVLSGLYGLFLILRTAVLGVDVPGYPSIMVATLFLSGIQLISLGVLGEYIGRIFTEVKGRPLYLVSERLGFEEPRS